MPRPLLRPSVARAVTSYIVVLLLPASVPGLASASAAQKADTRQRADSEMAVLRACVAGATLTAVSPEADGGGSGQTYRIAGARGLVKQLKGEHDGHYEEVTGRVRGEFAPPNGRRLGTVGKVGIVIGAGPSGGSPNAPRVPEMPSFQVKSARHLADRCPR
jgi:hypothetical protein